MPYIKYTKPKPVVVIEALMLGLPVELPGLGRRVQLQKTGDGDEMAIGDWGSKLVFRAGQKTETDKYFRGIAGYDLSEFISDCFDLDDKYIQDLQNEIDRVAIVNAPQLRWDGIEMLIEINENLINHTRYGGYVLLSGGSHGNKR